MAAYLLPWMMDGRAAGCSVCAPSRELSLSRSSCTADCSPLIALLKLDPAADLLLSATIPSVTSLTCVHTARVCVRVKGAKWDRRHFSRPLFHKHQPTVHESLCFYRRAVALVHSPLSLRRAKDHITSPLCNCAPFVTARTHNCRGPD